MKETLPYCWVFNNCRVLLMKKTLTRNLFGEMVEEKPRKLCTYCGKGFIRLDLHLVFCPKNPLNKHPILNTIEEIPPQTELKDNKIIKIPLLNMKKLVFYPIEGRYWCKRKELNALHPEYKISGRQFINLTKEKVEYYDCYWLEEGLDKDFIRMPINEFREIFDGVKKIHTGKNPGEYVLLSVSIGMQTEFAFVLGGKALTLVSLGDAIQILSVIRSSFVVEFFIDFNRVLIYA